jgi:hypothetical protein
MSKALAQQDDGAELNAVVVRGEIQGSFDSALRAPLRMTIKKSRRKV